MSSQDATARAKCSPPGGTLGWVGSYQLVERMPYQGGAIEYLARQRGPLGFVRSCRLKLVPSPSHGGDKRAAEAVVREAKVVNRLDHPNVVRFYDLFEHRHNLALVIEHFSSLSLAQLLSLLSKQRETLDEKAVWHVAHGVFSALAHSHGIVDGAGKPDPIIHSDVRPANVLLNADGRVRLTGFGHARCADEGDNTACGQIGRGASYVAPEQMQGRGVTECVDTFAAALMVWELLARRSATPHGIADVELLQHLSCRQVDALRGLRPDLPPLVTAALDACLAESPAERTIQAKEVAGCIAAAMDLRRGEESLREAIASLGAVWEGLAASDPSSSPVPRSGRSVPPSSGRRERSPAFSVSIPAAPPVPQAPDAVPPWDEVTRVPVPPKSKVVDPPWASLGNPIRHRSDSPPGRVGISSVSPISRSLDSTLPASRKPASGHRQWVLAIPVTMVVAVMTFAAIGSWRQKPAGAHGPTRAASAPVAQPSAVATSPQPQPDPEPKPEADTVAEPVAAKARESSEPEPPPLAETSSAPVPPDRAELVVTAPPEGWVYVQGAPAGQTGTPIHTSCGRRFVRVGTEPDERGMAGVSWLAPGRGVLLRCGERHVIRTTPR